MHYSMNKTETLPSQKLTFGGGNKGRCEKYVQYKVVSTVTGAIKNYKVQ